MTASIGSVPRVNTTLRTPAVMTSSTFASIKQKGSELRPAVRLPGMGDSVYHVFGKKKHYVQGLNRHNRAKLLLWMD